MRSAHLQGMIPRRTVGLACAAAVCVTLLAQGDGRASTGALTVALDYAAASTCPEVGEFKAIVVGRLGYDAFREDASDRVLVHIEARDHAFEGRIEWRNVDGKWVGDRTFPSRSDDCGGLARAVAFALALQIQFSALRSVPAGSHVAALPETGPMGANPDSSAVPSATTSPSSDAVASSPDESESPPVPPVPSPTPSQQKDVAAVTESAASPDRAPGPALAVGAGASVGFGLSSSAVALGRLFGSLAWVHWSLELAAEAG